MAAHVKAKDPRRWLRLLGLVAIPLSFALAGGTAWAFWLAGSTATSNGASAATSVNAGATPTTSVAGTTVTVSWAASTLASGVAVTGYQVNRYDATTLVAQTMLTACTGTVSATSCVESAVPQGNWKYSVTPVFATNWRGAESAKSTTAIVDNIPPVNAITLSSVTGAAYLSGTNLYYLGTAAGSFKLTNAVTDSGTGPASSQTATLTGTSTGWTHVPSTVSAPAGGPYVSNVFSWTAGTSTGPGEAVVGRDVIGNTATTNLTFVNDITGPAGATVSYADGLTGGTNVSVSFTAGSDAGSGIGTRLLQRASATATMAGACGAYGAFATVTGGTNPTSPLVDTVTIGNCYKYQYVVSDNLGNTSTATNTNVARAPYGAIYPMSEGSGTTIADSTGMGNTATFVGSPTWATGRIGSAVTFPGANTSYIDIPRPVIDTSQSYSVSAWVKLNSPIPGGNQTFAAIEGTHISPFYLQLEGGVFKFTERAADNAGSAQTKVAGPAAVAGQWYHLVGVYNQSAGTIQLYVNGISQGTAAYSSGWKATGDTVIGRAKFSDGPVDATYGTIDEVGFYDRALTQNEITILAGAYSTVVNGTAGLLNYWRLDEGSGTTATDSKSADNGTYFNAPTLGVAGVNTNDTNTAVQFDGTNDYVQAARQISTDFSVEFWFKSTQNFSNNGASPACTLWTQGASMVDNDFNAVGKKDFGISMCSGKITAGVGDPVAGTDPTIVTSGTYNDGAWHQLVMTRTQSTGLVTLYMDGASVGTVTGTNKVLNSQANVSFGRSMRADNYFNGTLDEIAFYNVALSGATVLAHYNAAG